MDLANNRRLFSRFPFNGQARLSLSQGEQPVGLADISLKGAMVRIEAPPLPQVDQVGVLTLQLGEDESVAMWVRVAYVKDGWAGLHAESIDLDSMTHLRRLVELNSGDEALLERELGQLVRSAD